MTREWRAALGALALLVGIGITGGLWYVGGAVPAEPCPEVSHAQTQARGISFTNGISTSQTPSNGILIRAVDGRHLECVQVLDRARCSTDGPTTFRVLAGNLVAYFDVPEGRAAIVRAAPDGIACGLAPARNA